MKLGRESSISGNRTETKPSKMQARMTPTCRTIEFGWRLKAEVPMLPHKITKYDQPYLASVERVRANNRTPVNKIQNTGARISSSDMGYQKESSAILLLSCWFCDCRYAMESLFAATVAKFAAIRALAAFFEEALAFGLLAMLVRSRFSDSRAEF
jgi:hypothetical protein